jgi:hypothetical protein
MLVGKPFQAVLFFTGINLFPCSRFFKLDYGEAILKNAMDKKS